jgi:2-phosphoglycerate kinase
LVRRQAFDLREFYRRVMSVESTATLHEKQGAWSAAWIKQVTQPARPAAGFRDQPIRP